MIKVLLADDHIIVRVGLRRIIDATGDMEVVGEASTGRDAIRQIRKKRPDVVVIDISMPEMDGIEVINRIRDQIPDIPILVLTMHEEEQYVVRALEAGAMGYITKSSAPEHMVNAIKKLNTGNRYLTPEVAELLAMRVTRGVENRNPIDTLSTRELQVLKLLALGGSNRGIADEYNISIKTVDTYRFRILKKLNLRNNADLSRFAIQNRIIEP